MDCSIASSDIHKEIYGCTGSAKKDIVGYGVSFWIS